MARDQEQQSWIEKLFSGLNYSGLPRDHKGGLANRWGMLQRDLSRYGQKVGTGHKRILIPKKVLSESDVGDLGFVGVNVAIPEAGQTKLRSFRHPDHEYHLHEHGQYWTMHRDSHVASTMALAKMRSEGKSVGKLETITETIKGLPHLITEGLPGLYYYLSGRLDDTEGMASRLIRDLPKEFKQKMNALAGSRSIPTENRGYDQMDGMAHGGLAGVLRKQNTLFGSKYDRARAIADLMGMSYDALLGSSMFRQALKGAKVQKRLGEGVAGVADLMKTTVGGHELEFVQKTLHPAEVTLARLKQSSASALARGEFTSADLMRNVELHRDIFKEGRALAALRDTSTVPSTYSIGDDVLMMEAMPGVPLRKLRARGETPPAHALKDLRETILTASREGLSNRDIHSQNIMFDPVTGRTSWIDWGAVLVSPKPTSKGEMQDIALGMARPLRDLQRFYKIPEPGRRAVAAVEKGTAAASHQALRTEETKATAAAKPAAFRIQPLEDMSSSVSVPSQLRPKGMPMPSEFNWRKQLAREEQLGLAETMLPSRANPFGTTAIDGMAEGGLAQVKRKLNTEFGSAWRGMLKDAFQRMRGNITGLAVPFFGRAPAVGTAKLLDPRRAAQIYEGASLGEFAAALTKQTGFKAHIGSQQTDPFIAGMAERFKSFGAGGASFFQRRAGAGAVVVDPTQLRSSIERLAQKRGIDAALTKKVLEGDRAQKVLLYHEFLEGQALARFPGAAQMGSHQTAHVMLGEAGLVGRLKDKELKRFFTQLRRKNTAEKDVYRAGIRGFQEEGEAAVLRKFFSDFGSGYQGLAASTSKQLIGSTRAKNSLHLSSIDLRAAQEKIWHCAIRGGRYHNRKNRDFVKQLSRFGGGV